MYEKLSKLNDSVILELQNLLLSVPLTDQRKRVGANGIDKMSIYKHSKWTLWNRQQKSIFKSAFNQSLVDKAVMGWILHFPSKTGFLDLMTAWKDQKICGTIVAYALEDQQIILNGTDIDVKKGEGIKFKLSVPHEIKPSLIDQNWACLMLLESN
jgi:hypothetical protein